MCLGGLLVQATRFATPNLFQNRLDAMRHVLFRGNLHCRISNITVPDPRGQNQNKDNPHEPLGERLHTVEAAVEVRETAGRIGLEVVAHDCVSLVGVDEMNYAPMIGLGQAFF